MGWKIDIAKPPGWQTSFQVNTTKREVAVKVKNAEKGMVAYSFSQGENTAVVGSFEVSQAGEGSFTTDIPVWAGEFLICSIGKIDRKRE